MKYTRYILRLVYKTPNYKYYLAAFGGKGRHLNREDMSLVLHSMRQLFALPLNQGTENTKVAKSLNFVPIN